MPDCSREMDTPTGLRARVRASACGRLEVCNPHFWLVGLRGGTGWLRCPEVGEVPASLYAADLGPAASPSRRVIKIFQIFYAGSPNLKMLLNATVSQERMIVSPGEIQR